MRAVFEWVDAHPASYWIPAILATLALTGWIAWGVRAAAREKPWRHSGWVFAGLLLLFLAAWRWPYFLAASEYNPDESQFIAGAMTLARDPVFWRSVDGVTSGPLDFYALLPLHWLGLPFDYFSARVTALLLTWLALLFVQRLFRARAPAAVAQLAVLPGAVFFATATAEDFVHYSSELTPLALLALALSQIERRPLVAAFVAGCLPWAKLQAAPLAGAVVGWQLWQAWKNRPAGLLPWRRGAGLVGLAAAPSLLGVILVAAFGQFGHFYRRFFLQNVTYVQAGMPFDRLGREMTHFIRVSGNFSPWLGATLLLLTLLGLIYFLPQTKPPRKLPPAFWLGAALTLMAVVCIVIPARASLHYLLFLAVPLTLWTGVLLCDLWKSSNSRRLLSGLAFLCALAPFYSRVGRPAPSMIGHLAEHWRHPYTPLGQVLRHLHQPGARMAVWGWLSSAYVEGDLPQATQDTVSQWCIVDVPQREYYRATFLSDLQRNRPEVFVDAVGPGAFGFERRELQAHEIFPALAEYIHADYVLVVDTGSARIYARRDLPALADLGLANIDCLLAQGRGGQPANPARPDATDVASLSLKLIDGRQTMKLEPPGLVEWPLEADIREVYLMFGLDPIAYEPGRSNGAGVTLELTDGKRIRPLYHRQLDPAREPRDRGLQPVLLVLPPFAPGTRLVLRTDPGLNGDTTWDWMHFTALEVGRSPGFLHKQFPGFDPVPTAVEAENSALVTTDRETRLQLPPPAALHYELQGSERRLAFEYGLRPGAYTNGGRTDGAIFVVELVRVGAPPQPLFRRHLQPLAVAADRGPQQLDLPLPPLHQGDRLTVRIDAGPAGDSAWDWTYLAALKLH